MKAYTKGPWFRSFTVGNTAGIGPGTLRSTVNSKMLEYRSPGWGRRSCLQAGSVGCNKFA